MCGKSPTCRRVTSESGLRPQRETRSQTGRRKKSVAASHRLAAHQSGRAIPTCIARDGDLEGGRSVTTSQTVDAIPYSSLSSTLVPRRFSVTIKRMSLRELNARRPVSDSAGWAIREKSDEKNLHNPRTGKVAARTGTVAADLFKACSKPGFPIIAY